MDILGHTPVVFTVHLTRICRVLLSRLKQLFHTLPLTPDLPSPHNLFLEALPSSCDILSLPQCAVLHSSPAFAALPQRGDPDLKQNKTSCRTSFLPSGEFWLLQFQSCMPTSLPLPKSGFSQHFLYGQSQKEASFPGFTSAS